MPRLCLVAAAAAPDESVCLAPVDHACAAGTSRVGSAPAVGHLDHTAAPEDELSALQLTLEVDKHKHAHRRQSHAHRQAGPGPPKGAAKGRAETAPQKQQTTASGGADRATDWLQQGLAVVLDSLDTSVHHANETAWTPLVEALGRRLVLAGRTQPTDRAKDQASSIDESDETAASSTATGSSGIVGIAAVAFFIAAGILVAYLVLVMSRYDEDANQGSSYAGPGKDHMRPPPQGEYAQRLACGSPSPPQSHVAPPAQPAPGPPVTAGWTGQPQVATSSQSLPPPPQQNSGLPAMSPAHSMTSLPVHLPASHAQTPGYPYPPPPLVTPGIASPRTSITPPLRDVVSPGVSNLNLSGMAPAAPILMPSDPNISLETRETAGSLDSFKPLGQSSELLSYLEQMQWHQDGDASQSATPGQPSLQGPISMQRSIGMQGPGVPSEQAANARFVARADPDPQGLRPSMLHSQGFNPMG